MLRQGRRTSDEVQERASCRLASRVGLSCRCFARGKGKGVGGELVDGDLTEMATVAEVVKKAPNVVICLLTALQFHHLTSELPHAVWIVVEGSRRAPKIDFVKTEVVRASGQAFSHGVEQVVIEGAKMKITDPAKTVADCFRYRNHIGVETAYTALRDFVRRVHERRGGKYNLRSLTEAAKADRVYNVMRPSLEALVV